MNILITGGTGFIGTELRHFFLKRGDYLTVVTRSPERHENESATNQLFIRWDNHDIIKALEQTDVVINLVGESIFGKPWTKQIKKRMYSSRIDTTRQLVEAIARADKRPELFISTSGVNFYGDRGDEILNEEEPAGEEFLSRLCVDWEKVAEPVKGLGVRLVIFRNGIVLEKGGGAFQYLLPIFKLGLGGSVGDGTQYLPWIHMMDVCRAIDFAIENEGLNGPCNLCTPTPVTMDELVESLGEVLRRPTIFRVPEILFKFILGEASQPILQSVRAYPECLLKEGFEFYFTDLKEALSDIV